MSTQHSPIQINLDGNFVIPRDGMPHVVGHINPDLRLECLDSFLGQLDAALAEGRKAGKDVVGELNDGFAAVISKAFRGVKTMAPNVNLILDVTCETDPKSHRMTFSFCINGTVK